MTNEDKIINKLIGMETFLHEKVATKDELRKAKTEIMSHIDGFAQRQENFDHELVSMRSRMDRMEGKA